MAKTDVAVAETMSGGLVMLDEDMAQEVEGVAGAGASDNPDDRGTPLLYIAQKGSRQVNKKEPLYIEGLEVGMCFNNLTGRFWNTEHEPLVVLPCFFRVNLLEWTPQDAGGGFHGTHPRDTPLLKTATQRKMPDGSDRRDVWDLPNGHELILTHHYFCLIEETLSPIVVPMASTNLGASARMQALIDDRKGQLPSGQIITLPAYFQRFGLRTVYDKNDKGDWYKYAPSVVGPNEDRNVRELCKKLAIAAKNQEIEIADPDAASSASAGGVGSQELDDEIPI